MKTKFSLEEASVGAELTLENARRLEESARILGEQGIHGPAVSLLVLAGEEAAKASFFAQHVVKEDYPDEEVRKLLMRHTPRHDIARMYPVLQYLAEQVVEREIQKRADELEDWNQKEVDPENPNPERLDAIGALIRRISAEMAESLLELELDAELAKEFEWWKQANDLKMRGFYVDPVEDGWKTPSRLSESDYREAAKYVGEFINEVADDVEHLNSISGTGLENLQDVIERGFGPDFQNLPEELRRLAGESNESSD